MMSDAIQEKQEQMTVGDALDVLRPYLNENIAALNVSEENYLSKYAEQHDEWVEGVLFAMSPSSVRHPKLFFYLIMFFKAYFEHRPVGTVQSEPFTMKIGGSYRQPDLQIILNDNPYYTKTGTQGPTDICIEIVSPESEHRDYNIKYTAYEQGYIIQLPDKLSA